MPDQRYSGRHRAYQGRHRVSPQPLRDRGRRPIAPTALAAVLVAAAAGVSVDAPIADAQVTLATDVAFTSASSRATREASLSEARREIQFKAEETRARIAAGLRADRERKRAEPRRKRAALAKEAERRAAAEAARLERRRWVLPISGAVFTSGFGYRWGRMHEGDDFGAPVGTRLVAMSSGTVTAAGWAGAYGNKVEIRYADGTVSVYAHMDTVVVSVGQQVTVGQFVGRTGNTGRSTGPHLHLEIHPGGGVAVDPSAWLSARGLQA